MTTPPDEKDWGAWAAVFGERPLRTDSLAYERIGSPGSTALHLLGERSSVLPAVARDATCAVVLCGLLSNQSEIRARFAPSNGKSDDAALILSAFRQRGEAVLGDLRGTFAVLIWDSAADLLLCARDPLGMFPLFYAKAPEGFAFSTAIDSLMRFAGVPRTVNRGALAGHLSSLHQRRDTTFFKAVRRIPPGHAFRWHRRTWDVRNYWTPLPVGDCIPWIRGGEAERFRFLFDQALDRCLSGRPTGIFLSGGLDSASVAAVAIERCRQNEWPLPVAFSQIFPDPGCNEEPVQRGVAEQLGLDQVCMTFDQVAPHGFLRASLEQSARLSAPLHNFWLPAYHALGLAARDRGCDAIITGGGGDEWLSVTPMLAADLIRSLDFSGLYRLSRVLPNSYDVRASVMARHLFWTCGMRPLLGAFAARALDHVAPAMLRAKRRAFRPIPSWILRDPALHREMEEELEPVPSALAVGGFYALEMRLALDHYLFSMESEENFEHARQGGLPIRKPFLDPDLVELLCRIPPDRLCSGERTKGLVREMLSERFPALGFERQKKIQAVGFFRSLLVKEGGSAWAEMGGLTALARLGIVDEASLRLTIDNLLVHNDPKVNASEMGHILISEAWLRPRI